MRALIIANGELIDTGALKRRIQAEKFDLVAAADGGARNAGRLGSHPQIVIGDMDSLPDTERAALKGAKFISYPPQKDATDLELALIYAREHGADHIVVIGATGGRLESTVANTLMLAQTKLNDCDIEMWHGLQTARLILPP